MQDRNIPILQIKLRHGGFEPPTPWLKVKCSTNWANISNSKKNKLRAKPHVKDISALLSVFTLVYLPLFDHISKLCLCYLRNDKFFLLSLYSRIYHQAGRNIIFIKSSWVATFLPEEKAGHAGFEPAEMQESKSCALPLGECPMLSYIKLLKKIKWTLRDSNPRPFGYEPNALTNWAKRPYSKYNYYISTI